MLKKIAFSLLVLGLVSGIAAESRAQGPFEFQFGYSLGYQNSFRNRLPTPPYFAVYPPVYYGHRYERPYGESPFASWPLLQANESYMPVRATNRVPVPPVVCENPFIVASDYPAGKPNRTEAVADKKREAIKPLVIVNPYVKDLVASK